MAEKKATAKKATETKAAAAKKTTTVKKAEKTVLAVNAENAGFKAGDVYQALAAEGKALTVKEIAKAAKISEEETLLGLGWLFKEGKLRMPLYSLCRIWRRSVRMSNSIF